MTELELAQEARRSLAKGLEAVQAEDAPPGLQQVAQPLARAMSALVQVGESEPLDVSRIDAALDALREALGLLQRPEHSDHSATAQGMEAVAKSLGSVRDLSERAKTKSAPQSPPAGTPAGPSDALPERDPAWKQVEAALGAHSATNFYKGLTPGDVVSSGGLFIETYQAPDVGETVWLRVSMPGGYDFEAVGRVAWTRAVEASSTASGAPPGFGAELVHLTEQARGLIQRYVRNREPLFHDDL